MQVVRIIEGSKGGLEAIKLTGDANVPAGQLSWRCPEIEVGSKVEGELQLADTGYRNPVFESVQASPCNQYQRWISTTSLVPCRAYYTAACTFCY